MIETYETTRDIAKNLFIRLAYFGSFDAWKDEFEIKSNKKLKFIENYTMELKCIGLEIVNNNPKLLKSIQKLNKNNETASLVSTLLQEHEKRILECCFNYLRLQNIILDNAVLCFDVIMIPTDKYNIKLLLELSKVVKDELDFDVNFSQKDMNNDYLQEIKDIVDTDGFAFKSEQFELNHCKIVNKSLYLKHSDNDIIVFSSKKLNESYCDLVYGAEENSFISKWVNKNPRIRKYDDMNIYPHPLKCPTNEFNLWTPFEMSKYKDNYENNETGLNFLLNHIKIICDNDETVKDDVISWIAQMLQFPAVKTVCLSFVGLQGTGKSSIVRLCEALIGKSKVLETTSPSRDCWGDFNGPMLNAFLVSYKQAVEIAEEQAINVLMDGNNYELIKKRFYRGRI